MTSSTDGAVARVRATLVLTLVALASVLTSASVAPAATAQAVVLLTALSAATALVGVHCLHAAAHAGPASLRTPRRSGAVPLVLAGRTTDAAHHPVRPRAPGLV